jgi:hypothetical protein
VLLASTNPTLFIILAVLFVAGLFAYVKVRSKRLGR